MPTHPNAGVQGHVYEHRYLVEQALGRLLSKDEIVHHKDGNKLNNSIDNLEVLTKWEHQQQHAKERALLACGDPNKMKCSYCKEYDLPENMYVRPNQYQAWHHLCASTYKRVDHPTTGPYAYNNPPMKKEKLKLNER